MGKLPPARTGTAPELPAADCTDAGRELAGEEAYLERPEPARFVAEGGFTRSLERFHTELCRTTNPAQAERTVAKHSTALWRDAVKRAQGQGPVRGTLSAGDDRPLYWTRLAMAATLRQWGPQFALSEADRQGLIDDLDRISRRQVDAFATTSQGRPGQFDLEAVNGAWRGGFTDNEQVCYRGVAPIPEGIPTIDPQPQWTLSSHPVDAMRAADTGPYPVIDNRQVTEVPGDTPPEPVTTDCPAPANPGTVREDGPTPGSQARAGGGGDYLSNEIAYRATLLRDALGLEAPGGHIHTPVLEGLDAENPAELTNPTFEANREAITAQVQALVTEVGRSVQ